MNIVETEVASLNFKKDVYIPIFVEKYFNIFNSCNSQFPIIPNRISFYSKLKKKRELNTFINSFMRKIENRKDLTDSVVQKTVFTEFKKFFTNTLEFEKSHSEMFFNENFKNLTNEFISKAKEFDHSLTTEELFQAIRNVWIMNTIQLLFNINVELTPSIFAYSLLYPYSDNYLDDDSISIKSKNEFLVRFEKKLAGEEVYPFSKNEEKIFSLVEMIEDEFPRHDFPDVYESLLAIHYGQIKSINQQSNKSISFNTVLKTSIEKGGSSVLADAYLVLGKLSYEEAEFMFGFGFFLQLIDDLQDIQEDKKNNHSTIFSNVGSKNSVANNTNKLFSLVDIVLFTQRRFINADKLLNVIKYSCQLLIIDSIASNRKLFPYWYNCKMSKHSLYPLTYYKTLHQQINSVIKAFG